MANVDLFQAIRINDIDKFFSEIDNQNINQTNEDNQNFLHEAIAFNNSLLAKELIKRNININHGDTKYQTPLHYVAMQKSPEFVELILKNGGKSNLEDIYGNQALWTAVFNAKGNYTVVEAFLKFKQDVEHKNKYGKSPLDFAKQITDQFLIKILENHKNLSYSGFN